MWEAFSTGDIAGSPYTDLYPSVWSLWATESWWGTWKNVWFNYPTGQTWSPNTLIWGTLVIPLKPYVSIGILYNFSLLANRLLTCLSFYMAGCSWNKKHGTGLLWMIVLGMNPMLHGFAVEGIIEGTQLWPIGFWFWAYRNNLRSWNILFGCLTIVSNWYWSVVWMLTLWILRPSDLKYWRWMLTSILFCSPWILHFYFIQDDSLSLSPEMYRAMGFQFDIPNPNYMTPSNPFAQSNYIGWVLSFATLYVLRHSKDMIVKRPSSFDGMVFLTYGAILCVGFSWMQYVPVIGSMRFPYRMYILVLMGIAILLSDLHSRHQSSLAYLVLIEFILLSPIDVVIPTSPAEYPEYVSTIDGPILELPGLLTRAPGEIDPSRPRMKRIMYYQTHHSQPSAWALSFNGLNTVSDCFSGTSILDPKATAVERSVPLQQECWKNVHTVVIHNNNTKLNAWLQSMGFHEQSADGLPHIWSRP